ncbi:MAG: hypothetical protein JWO81_185 [Alphaproteobacteria bacterium]|nr:hypothetical protein [Alphaproteobacteria bacterium]
MKRIYLVAPALSFALFATPLLAKGHSDAAPSETSAPSAQTAVDTSAKAEPKICKTFENTASRMKAERLCLTRQEWKKFDDAQ